MTSGVSYNVLEKWKKKIYNSPLLGKVVSVTADIANYWEINGQIYMFAEADTAKLRKIKTIIIFIFFIKDKYKNEHFSTNWYMIHNAYIFVTNNQDKKALQQYP